MNKLTREEAITKLRSELKNYVDDEHSMCEVAARLNIFCGGFAQWTFSELKKRYPMIVRSRPRITPAELKELANRWQLARQFVNDDELACDTQCKETHHQICKGWDEHDEQDLAKFCCELTEQEVRVVPDPVPETAS